MDNLGLPDFTILWLSVEESLEHRRTNSRRDWKLAKRFDARLFCSSLPVLESFPIRMLFEGVSWHSLNFPALPQIPQQRPIPDRGVGSLERKSNSWEKRIEAHVLP
jgi:hypothetical protein